MEHEQVVHVDAAPDEVWRVLMDVERWPEWTSSMTWLRRVEPVPLADGSEIQIKQPRLKAAVWVVTQFQAGRSFSWQNSGAGVTTVAEHELTAAADGTDVTLRLRQTGWLSGLSGLLGGGAVRRMVATEAAGLKARCENGRRPA